MLIGVAKLGESTVTRIVQPISMFVGEFGKRC